MAFRSADTLTDSLARLTAEEQKAVKTTAFDLQLNPATPGLRQLIKPFGNRSGFEQAVHQLQAALYQEAA